MNTWVIQVLVLLSFSAQFFLVFFASRKNRTNKKWLMMLISAIYFLANWVAPFAEARQFFLEKSVTDPTQARQALLSQVTNIDPSLPGGVASESVWKYACRLAKQLITNFEYQRRWDLIRTVGIELLVCVAFNSKAIAHILQLGEGAEVLTVVWLLMNHLGLGKNFSKAPTPNLA